MDDLECRLISRKQFLKPRQEQEHRQQQRNGSRNIDALKAESLCKPSTPKTKLIRSDTASSFLSAISIQTASSSMYDPLETLTETCTSNGMEDADMVSESLNDDSEGNLVLARCDSSFIVVKEDKDSTLFGPIDVDEFIPKNSMYFEEDYGDWFILDEIEMSRGLAGYEIGFEPETIWSVDLNEITTSFRKKKSGTALKSIYENSGKSKVVPGRKPKLSRARSSNT
jgi:hypothetical protein